MSDIKLSVAQLAKIDEFGKAKNYPAMYRYISDEIKTGRISGVSADQAYWFEQAGPINQGDVDVA